jgi:curved DNA-binding protein CbpA
MQRRSEPDPHAVLGVSPNASLPEITTAYRALIRRLHPDNPQHADAERLAEVIAAYRALRAAHRDAPSDDGEQRVDITSEPPRAVRVPVSRTRQWHGPDLRAGPVRHHRPTP